MGMVMDMDMVTMDIMAKGLLKPNLVMDIMAMDMDIMDMGMVTMGIMARDLPSLDMVTMVMDMDMVMDTMVKLNPLFSSQSSKMKWILLKLVKRNTNNYYISKINFNYLKIKKKK